MKILLRLTYPLLSYVSRTSVATMLFLVGIYSVYTQGMAQLEKERTLFLSQRQGLIGEKGRLEKRLRQLNAELLQLEENTWIEWNLIERLGVVPDGYQKVYLRRDYAVDNSAK